MLLLHYQVIGLCCVAIQAGAQFAHFPATGGGREASRTPSRAPPPPSPSQPTPPSPSRPRPPLPSQPPSQSSSRLLPHTRDPVENYDYDDYDYDQPVQRKPIPRIRGRTIVNSRVQSVDKNVPRKPVERERPRISSPAGLSTSGSIRSQPSRETLQRIQAETTRRPFIAEFSDNGGVQAEQFQQAAPFTQLQPRIEQSRLEENTPVFTDKTQTGRLVPAVRPAPVQRQQVEQRQQQPLQTQPVFDSLFSNTVVAPQQGEQGEGVYFSYTATLGY